ncbi:integrase [Streptomyces goshikiensis]|uniref:integrase n=1 Tax=Streptomyces goshikiensis TaxID=1942 RepID=UPI0037A1A5C4
MTIVTGIVDPYVLPMPHPASPVVDTRWISPHNTHPNSLYHEYTWSLAPLIDNPSTGLRAINWRKCPKVFQSQVRLVAWTMINGEIRPTDLQRRGMRARGRSSPLDMVAAVREWTRLARWLHQHGIDDLGDCTDGIWRDYIPTRWAAGTSRRRARQVLGHLTRLWDFDLLSAHPSGIARPPWEAEGADDFLPGIREPGGGENSTEPLDPQVIGPLMVWAIRVVEDVADDILDAWEETQRLTATAASNRSTPGGRAALEAFLAPLMRFGTPLPAFERGGSVFLARTYVAGMTGASLRQTKWLTKRHRLSQLAARQTGPCPLRVPVTGLINGRPWREHMDFTEAATLMRHLGTAAAIVCLYLTGMRPQEVLGMRSGCCPDPESDQSGVIGRHLIRSHHFKNVTDHDGNQVSAGAERDVPWVAITPVVNAIRVLERIVPHGELLLSASHHDFTHQHKHPGALKLTALRTRIEDFVAWANREALAHDLPDQVIPEDPHGAISTARFRRSLAWHIARRPGGLVALAIQYGHMRTALDTHTANGYGARSRGGIHSVLDIETALAAADTAAQLRDRVATGEKISGPAARRAITAAAHAPRFEGRLISAKFAKQAAAYLARDGIVLHDNPDAYLICAFKRDTALCDRTAEDTVPTLNDCRPGCGNAVRTDTHARQLRERADEIDQLAAHAPDGTRQRLHRNANRLRETADAHETTKVEVTA